MRPSESAGRRSLLQGGVDVDFRIRAATRAEATRVAGSLSDEIIAAALEQTPSPRLSSVGVVVPPAVVVELVAAPSQDTSSAAPSAENSPEPAAAQGGAGPASGAGDDTKDSDEGVVVGAVVGGAVAVVVMAGVVLRMRGGGRGGGAAEEIADVESGKVARAEPMASTLVFDGSKGGDTSKTEPPSSLNVQQSGWGMQQAGWGMGAGGPAPVRLW